MLSRPGSARVYGSDALDGLTGTVRFDCDALDAWFEDDEEVFVHPRSPYTRVDALRSTRTVRIELDGITLAESSSPVMVFETGLRARYYLNRTEVSSRTCSPRQPLRRALTRAGPAATGQSAPVRPSIPTWHGPTISHPPAPADRRNDRLLQREGRCHHRRAPARTTSHAFLPVTPIMRRARYRADALPGISGGAATVAAQFRQIAV